MAITSNDNGALGEARVQSFLLQRFWVSRRSSDVHGADFLIEQRKLGARMTDVLPPRMGLVQAKYSQNARTTHYIPRDYVLTSDGEPLRGFFLVVTVGLFEQSITYMLTAAELAKFPAADKKGKPHFRVSSGKALKPFLVDDASVALSRMEHILEARSIEDQDRFLKSVSVPNFEFDRLDLDEKWTLAIPNEHAFLPDEFYRIRSALRAALYVLDPFLGASSKILNLSDLGAAPPLLEKIRKEFEIKEGLPWILANASLAHLAKDQFEQALAVHEERYDALVQHNLLQQYREVTVAIWAKHTEFFEANKAPRTVGTKAKFWFADDEAVTIVKLDAHSLQVTSVRVMLVPKGQCITLNSDEVCSRCQLWQNEHEYTNSAWPKLFQNLIAVMKEVWDRYFPLMPSGKAKLPVLMMK